MTPEGLKREADIDRETSITPQTGRKLDRVIIATLVVALAYFVWSGQRSPDTEETTIPEPATVIEQKNEDDRSIAVLPFVNMSSDDEQEWFADGLTEELLNSLARMPELLVAARTSSFAYKGSTENVSTIAKELGVAHILEGSVRRGKDRLRITAQLIRASDGFHLWSETYDRTPDDVIAIQEDLAIEIAGALEIAMDPDALADMVSAGTASVPAYESYLEALAHDAQTTQSGDQRLKLEARSAYERALAIDPEFASAHFELAAFWNNEMTFNNIGSQMVDIAPQEKLRRFKKHIRAAIEHTTDEIGLDSLRGWEATVDLRFQEAHELTLRYMKARPNDSDASQQYVNVLMRTGRWDEALEHLGRAAELQVHRAFVWNGEYDDARELIPLIEASQLPRVNQLYAGLRQACADGDDVTAREIMMELERDFEDDVRWIPYHIVGQLDKIEAVIRPIHDSGQLYALSEFLNYPYFDPYPYPKLMAVLNREGIERPDPIDIPCACQL
jgi:TolB-like protein